MSNRNTESNCILPNHDNYSNNKNINNKNSSQSIESNQSILNRNINFSNINFENNNINNPNYGSSFIQPSLVSQPIIEVDSHRANNLPASTFANPIRPSIQTELPDPISPPTIPPSIPRSNFLYGYNIKYERHYLNINSAFRQKYTTYTRKNTMSLCNDPLNFEINNYTNNCLEYINQVPKYSLRIKVGSNHKYKIGDKITLNGIQYRKIELRTKIKNSENVYTSPFIFISGSEYLKICFNNATDIMPNLFNMHQKLYVEIIGFKSKKIGNINMNQLNGIHQVHFVTSTENFNPNIIYIKLCEIFKDKDNQYTFTESYNVTLKFLYIVGVPINLLNTNYPINKDCLKEFHIVSRIDNIHIYIDEFDNVGSFRKFGGSNVQISKLVELYKGYSCPNKYSINLGKSYHNVVSVKLVSSEIPYTGYSIISNNNKFYWENQDDDGIIYSINLYEGTYDVRKIGELLEKLINKVSRKGCICNKKMGRCKINNSEYLCKNIMKIKINSDTNIVTIRSYKHAILVKPIINVMPIENKNSPIVVVQIKHKNHGLKTGDIILIKFAMSHSKISAELINTKHEIEVLDENNYQFILNNINYLSEDSQTYGGNNVNIFVPNYFRLRLDFPDTICSLLGFVNNDSYLYSQFKTEITNITNVNLKNNLNITSNNAIVYNHNFISNPNNYILLLCKQFCIIENVKNNGINSCNTDHILAKIQLSGKPNTILYNTFVDTCKFFYDPINELNVLDFEFVNPNGTLYNFNGVDHSFTLEIVTVSNFPLLTEFVPSIGEKIEN